MKSERIEFIQALRGVAALVVVLRHCWEYVGNNIHNDIGTMLCMPAGTMGVDLFFIISGFIMVYTTWGQPGNVADAVEFYIKRFSRIVPAYAVIMLIEIFVSHGGLSFFASHRDLISLAKGLLFLPQGDISNPPYYGTPPLSVGWTLNYEIYFYAIFGVTMLFGRMRWIALAGVSILTLIVYPRVTRGTFSTNVYGNYDYHPFYLNLITNPIIWLFMAGVAIGIIYRSRFKFRNVTGLRVASFCSIAFVVWQYLSQYQMNHGITLWGLSLVPMVLCLALWNKAESIQPPKMLAYLGNISFSLYLVHISMMGIISKLATLFHAPFDGLSSYILMVAASVGAAAISHHYLEERLSRVVRRFLESILRTKTVGVAKA